ncbi:MAG: hypothetical protein QOD55_610, partial [Solirubrobacteraceae bacterium]|nr:hypothetical protein [Solirubrobacteraceae bacterium]
MDLRALQQPLKERYRSDPSASRITLTARGAEAAGGPVTCSIDLGRALYDAQAHPGVGGPGTGACSGDLLLGALAACAQLTCQMVATAMGLDVRRIEVVVEGDLDLRGTLGIDREVSAGFEAIRMRFEVDAPGASAEDIDGLMARTRRRPLPAHQVEPERAVIFGIVLGVVSFFVMAWFVNLLAAFLTLLAIAFYVVVYTMLLKRTTPQNIVIGGAAGALPPVIGW